MTDNTEAQETTEAPKALTRDEIRAKVFGAKVKVVDVPDFFGAAIQLRQPSLGDALKLREVDSADQFFQVLFDYAYVPGTEEKVFSAEDIDSLRDLPFGAEFQNLMAEVSNLLGVDPAKVEAEIKSAQKSTG